MNDVYIDDVHNKCERINAQMGNVTIVNMPFMPRAFTSRISKNRAFSNSKTYFINFNNSLYKSSHIKDSIFFFFLFHL